MDLSKIIQGKKLSETEEAILRYIIANIDTVLDQGVRTVAKENYTSPATVMRLSKKMGYNGFIDLYYHLEPMVRGSKAPMKQSYESYIGDLEKYQTEIEQFLTLLNTIKDKNIFIYATGFSGIIGEYIYKKLLVNGKRTLFASGTDSVGVLENNVEIAGLFLTITKSGETRQVVEKMKYFKEQGIPVVTFTNETDNSAARLADVVFPIMDGDTLDDRNIKGNYFFDQVLFLFETIMKEYQQN
ncbi:MurR/RpiR family transcriptional regulator [Jeotgalibaca sp. A122]|uniref:MurR/RpiR family transcriptional regulator n=1 Tax=Jeotgalibaca sp. A122 TaxID=3457322 RepID=UPI003FD038FA